MNKLLTLIIACLLLLMVGCTTVDEAKDFTINFEIKESYEHTLGDTKHNYKLDVIAQTSNNINLVDYVIVDDLGVNYMLIGTYNIYFTLIYEDYTLQKTATIEVKERIVIIEPTVIFEVVSSFEFVIGGDTPSYMAGVTAKLSNETSLIDDVVYDDSLVNYEVTGVYTVSFSLESYTNITPITAQVFVRSNAVPTNVSFNIYYLNDLHGAILNINQQIGLANIGNLIMDEKEKNSETTLFLTGGDILQGQLISNWYDGASTMELLNDMQLDAFVVGNHEFDWGIDVVTQYFDGTNMLQANFPLLGANVYEKATNNLAPVFEPYTIIEKSGIKIAVIGTMGYGLESSIAYARVKDYEFKDPVALTGFYAEKARIEDGADIVIAINHADDDYYNNSVANFTGNKRVDAIFNGHTHRAYTRTTNNKPIMQSGGNGSHVGHLRLDYSSTQGITGFSMRNLNQQNEVRLNFSNEMLSEKIDIYYNEIAGLYEPIMESGVNADRNSLAVYIGRLMQEKYGADVGLHNSGGTRDSISYLEGLSYAKLHAISPFDNSVVLVDVSGQELINAIGNETAHFRAGLSYNTINPNETYTLALNDYIFGARSFLRNKPADFTGVTVLDLFVESITNQSEVYSYWDMTLPLMFNQNVSLFTHLYTNYPQITI
jgi:2',3'-cyclic-nucleotide 2'-phosphodiesterase (5'-nucleotidase family)